MQFAHNTSAAARYIMNLKGLSVGYQNIHGLHDNFGCKASKLEICLKNDIEIWSEIWGCECKLKFDEYLLEN